MSKTIDKQRNRRRRNVLIPVFGSIALVGAIVSVVCVSKCSCHNEPEPPQPQPKTMVIKLVGGRDLPSKIDVGQTIQIAAYDGTDVVSGATFSTESTAIWLSGNTVTGRSAGWATINCSAPGYNDAQCAIQVVQPQPKTMVIKLASGEDLPSSIEIGQSITIAAYDETGTVSGATFSTESAAIELSGNTVIGKLAGNATIKCSAPGYNDAHCTIQVVQPLPRTMVIKLATGEEMPRTIELDESIEIAAFDSQTQQQISDVTFEAPIDAPFSIDGNKVTGESEGSGIIKCIAPGYYQVDQELGVTLKQINIKQVNGDPVPESIKYEQTIELAAFDRLGQQVENVEFSAYPEGIVNIDGNLITGIAKGTTEITCTVLDDPEYATDSVDLAVELKTMSIKKSDGSSLPGSIKVDESITIAAYDGETKITEDVEFTTESETINLVSIDNEAEVSGVSVGDALIVCKVAGYEDVEWEFNVVPPEPKDMEIKKADGTSLSWIDLNDTIEVAAFDGDQKLNNPTFSTKDIPQRLRVDVDEEGKVWITGIALGPTTLYCSVDGYKDTSIDIQVIGGEYELEEDDIEYPDNISIGSIESERDKSITIPWTLDPGIEIDKIIFAKSQDGEDPIEIDPLEWSAFFQEDGFYLDQTWTGFATIDTWEKIYVSIKASRYHDLALHLVDGVQSAAIVGRFEYNQEDDVEIAYELKEGFDAIVIDNCKLFDGNGTDITKSGIFYLDEDDKLWLDVSQIEDVDDNHKLNIIVSASIYNPYVNLTITRELGSGVGAYTIKNDANDQVIDVGVLLRNNLTLETKASNVEETTVVKIDGETYDSDSGIWTYEETNDENTIHIDLSKVPTQPTFESDIEVVLIPKPRVFPTKCVIDPLHDSGLDLDKPMTILNDKATLDIKIQFNLKNPVEYQINWDVSSTFVKLVDYSGETTVEIDMSWTIDKNNNTGTVSINDREIQKALESRGDDWIDNWALEFHVATMLKP